MEIPRSGDRYPVWYDAQDAETWMYATIAAEEGREQIRQLFGADVANTLTGFGSGAPAAAAPAGVDPIEQIKKLDELRDAGVLSEAEFETKKRELLAQI